jgi:hypothetical protein
MLRRSDAGTWVPIRNAGGDDSTASVTEGERRLMTAVLVHGLRSLFQDAARPGRGAARRLRQDLRWLTSADRNELFSFERICEALALNPDHVRHQVLLRLGAATQLLEGSPASSTQPFFLGPAVAVG